MEEAINGKEAISKIFERDKNEDGMYRLVIMELEMQVMNGLEATRFLKTSEACGYLSVLCPILMHGTHKSSEVISRCYEAGMVGVLPKPPHSTDIVRIIEQFVNN